MQREDKPSLLLTFRTETKQESLDSDCNSGAQCGLVDSEMASVKLEDCSPTLGLNVNIKDEDDVKHNIGESISKVIHTNPDSVENGSFQHSRQSFSRKTEASRSELTSKSKMMLLTWILYFCLQSNHRRTTEKRSLTAAPVVEEVFYLHHS
ncbi:hypothetical protein DPEC_G00138640 [Dallia pectoralis]|uniref:Uncharacterized protein n=1 Tax=Dallia pectoralis TaxID=75939 RepID=A0ACC2GLZ0_DALPE|nr:hypothetical protein DPEC_G00138640 [Dallia pectoralis]